MKTVAIAILTFAVGLVTGLRIGNHFIVGTVRNQFRSSSAQHQTLALVSVHALDELQAAVDIANLLLAGRFFRSIRNLMALSQKRELLDWPAAFDLHWF